MIQLNIPKIKTEYLKLFRGWVENLRKEEFEFPDLEKEIEPFQARLEKLLDKEEWSEDDAIELSVMFFICSILPELETEDEEETEDDQDEDP